MITGVFMRGPRKSRGIMVVELLAFMAVLLLLSSVIANAFMMVSARAKRSALAATLRELQTAVDAFYLTTGRWPSSGPALDCMLLGFDATDPDNNSFVPYYVRHEPDSRARSYGFHPRTALSFGISSAGRVFATLEPPDHATGWLNAPDTVYTCYAPDGVSPKTPALSGPKARVARITSETSREKAPVGGSVIITATAFDAADAVVANADLCFMILGSASGPEQTRVSTDSTGMACITLSRELPEIVRVIVVAE